MVDQYTSRENCCHVVVPRRLWWGTIEILSVCTNNSVTNLSITNLITTQTFFTCEVDLPNWHQIFIPTTPTFSLRTYDLDQFSRSQHYILYEPVDISNFLHLWGWFTKLAPIMQPHNTYNEFKNQWPWPIFKVKTLQLYKKGVNFLSYITLAYREAARMGVAQTGVAHTGVASLWSLCRARLGALIHSLPNYESIIF